MLRAGCPSEDRGGLCHHPGCWSRGKTDQAALENMKDAIHGYLETVEKLSKDRESWFVEVGWDCAQSAGDKSPTCLESIREVRFLDHEAGQTHHNDQREDDTLQHSRNKAYYGCIITRLVALGGCSVIRCCSFGDEAELAALVGNAPMQADSYHI